MLVELTAKYVGEGSGTFYTGFFADFLGSGGNTFDEGGAVTPNPIDDTGETFLGAEVSGDMVFEVPTEQIAGGLLILEDSVSFEEDRRKFFALE